MQKYRDSRKKYVYARKKHIDSRIRVDFCWEYYVEANKNGVPDEASYHLIQSRVEAEAADAKADEAYVDLVHNRQRLDNDFSQRNEWEDEKKSQENWEEDLQI